MSVKPIEKQKKIKKFFNRKKDDCTSFYFILCGERLKIVEARKDQHERDTGKSLTWIEATNLVILGK